jgi:hypothetical protein
MHKLSNTDGSVYQETEAHKRTFISQTQTGPTKLSVGL